MEHLFHRLIVPSNNFWIKSLIGPNTIDTVRLRDAWWKSDILNHRIRADIFSFVLEIMVNQIDKLIVTQTSFILFRTQSFDSKIASKS